MKPRELKQVPQVMEQGGAKAGTQFQALVSMWSHLKTETDHISLTTEKSPLAFLVPGVSPSHGNLHGLFSLSQHKP